MQTIYAKRINGLVHLGFLSAANTISSVCAVHEDTFVDLFGLKQLNAIQRNKELILEVEYVGETTKAHEWK